MGRDLTNLHISESFQYLLQISGSEVNDGLGNDVDSLNVSASYATTASFALNVTPIDTGSFYTSSSVSDATITFTQGDGTTEQVTVDNVASASFATTASFALNVTDPTLQDVTDAGATTDNAIEVFSGTTVANSNPANNNKLVITQTSGLTDLHNSGSDAVDFRLRVNDTNFIDLDTNGGNVVRLQQNTDVTGAVTASAGFKGDVEGNADSATQVNLTTTNTNQNYGIPLVESTDAPGNTDLLVSLENSLLFNPSTKQFEFADTTDVTVTGDLNVNGSITASNASFESASIGFLESITGSAKIIGDAFIILNADVPTERYAGIKVYDSGSTLATGSLQFDSQDNDWFYEYEDDDGTNFGGVMFGPEYATKGTPTYPTANTLVKGNGGHHLLDSSITDDGTDVTVSATLTADKYEGGLVALSGSTYYGNDGGGDPNYSDGVVIGYSSSLSDSQGTVVGADADGAADSTAIGHNASAGFSTTAVGKNSQAGNFGTAIGWGSSASNGGTVLGRAASTANNAVAIGGDATCDNNDAVAVGTSTDTDHQYGLALGHGAQATGALNMDIRVNNASIMTATTASQDIEFYGTASAPYFSGDGSQLTNLPSTSFPFTGSAEISGSLTMEGPGSLILNSTAGTANSITATDPAGNFILGGYQNTITGNNGFDLSNGIAASYNSDITSTGFDNFIAGANSSVISGTCQDSAILGANGATISGAGFNVIGGGDGNTISGGADRSGIIGGNGNTVTHDRSVVLGGTSLSSTKNNEVVVPNLLVKGNVVQDVNTITITSNTGSIDASLGSLFSITLQNGVSTMLEIENQVAGQTFQLKITNNATAAGTIEFDSQFEFEGGTAFEATAATSAVDILTLTTFDGTSVQCVGAKNFS
jgi:hypothetical protein